MRKMTEEQKRVEKFATIAIIVTVTIMIALLALAIL
tara:strand:- start:1049 stop:1156 length:108 start_codon:yes stop_codon:yes gene_type:complete